MTYSSYVSCICEESDPTNSQNSPQRAAAELVWQMEISTGFGIVMHALTAAHLQKKSETSHAYCWTKV
jgi:hypothetical protein